MQHLLVDELRDELERASALRQVLPLELLLEVAQQSVQKWLDYLGQLGAYDGHEAREHVRVVRRRGLRSQDRSGQESSATMQVQFEQLARDLADVLGADLVDEAVDGPLQ